MKNPVLYILMRTDMDSMNPGKAMAQAAHAQAQFLADISAIRKGQQCAENTALVRLYAQWRGSIEFGFGVTIVLDAGTLDNMEYVVKMVSHHERVIARVVVDPTYPLKDGEAMHYFRVSTCAYVFLDKAEGVGALVNLRLHP